MEFVALFVVIVAAVVVGNLISRNPKAFFRGILRVIATIMSLALYAAVLGVAGYAGYRILHSDWHGILIAILCAGIYVAVMLFSWHIFRVITGEGNSHLKAHDLDFQPKSVVDSTRLRLTDEGNSKQR